MILSNFSLQNLILRRFISAGKVFIPQWNVIVFSYHITLMSSMKHYFHYYSYTICGFPKIKMLGTIEDWKKLKLHTKYLSENYDLDWWLQEYVLPILDEFILSMEGRVNLRFWKTMYKVKFGNIRYCSPISTTMHELYSITKLVILSYCHTSTSDKKIWSILFVLTS